MLDIALAFALCIVWGFALVRTWLGLASLRELPSGLPLPSKPPLVSVVVAAKEEQDHIEETIRRLLKQTYPRIEIIAVNDRSTDATGAKIDDIKRWADTLRTEHPPLTVVHITQLPNGWLGKNHALYQGSLQARGTYLLFTDADVRFDEDAIKDAVAYALAQKADHVTLLPKMESRGFWLQAFVQYVLFSICLWLPPWLGNDDNQRKIGMGVGAFNLIRRETYDRIGTHRALSMRPDDDLRLGMLVKQAGCRQRVAVGSKRITVEWYPSLRAAVQGLEKNLYSGFSFRLPVAAAGVCLQLLCCALPLTALLWARGPAFGLYAAAAALFAAVYALHARRFALERGLTAAALPVSVYLFIWVMIRSIALTHLRKGVYWRGTFYKLDELKDRFR